MELRLLRYFVAVADELHFGRAAQRLFIAQPSLSAQIRLLEKEMGTPLFQRDRRSVSLTASGKALHEPARRLLQDADALQQIARSAAGSKRLVVGYVPYSRACLLPLLDAFRGTTPDASVGVRLAKDSTEVFRDLRDGRIDAGLLGDSAEAPWLAKTVLSVEPFCVALPSTHMLASTAAVPLPDLAQERFAMFPRESNPVAHDHLMMFFDEAGYRPSIGQASTQMDESLTFVASGGGVAIFPLSVAESCADRGVVFRPLIDPTPTVAIVLAWDVNSLNPMVPALVQATSRLLSDGDARSSG